MILHLPGNAEAGTFLDKGLFLQNVMLGLVSFGLGSYPQYSVAGLQPDHPRRARARAGPGDRVRPFPRPP
ncbi:MAG: hypothetical protein ACRDTT_05965 [Pseudonocardiaceae bacterium]